LASLKESAMPWGPDYYPPAMSRLPPDVRQKAIEIANALLAEGYDEGRAIRIAIAAAKSWAQRRSEEPLLLHVGSSE
jgi:uncharacterized protein YdaT